MTPLDFIQSCTPPGHVLKHVGIYRDASGTPFGAAAKYEAVVANGGEKRKKTFLQFVVENGELVCKGLPKPYSLYGLDQLAERPDAPVIAVEGEATADAAAERFPDYVVVTSPCGSKAAASADWSPLTGRTVIIWPDHDAAGDGYARDVAGLVPDAKVVPVPASFPEKWDLADDAPAGVTDEILAGMLLMAEAPPKPQAKPKRKTKDDLRKSAEEVKRERAAMIRRIKALRAHTVDKRRRPNLTLLGLGS
jgi:DNA primase